MKTPHVIAIVALIVGSSLALQAPARQQGVRRTDLQRHDLGVPGREVLFIPARTIHAAKNVGRGKGAELATYVVDKGKPLVVMVR